MAKLPHAHKGRPSAPHLKRQKMSVIGKTSYQHQHRMAFPQTPAAADASAPPAPPMAPGGDGGAGGPPAPPMAPGGGDGGPPGGL